MSVVVLLDNTEIIMDSCDFLKRGFGWLEREKFE
jgi:hypothetical protein